MTGVALNTFPNVLLIFNVCQCLLIVSMILGKVELYVTKNAITFLSAALVLFDRADLSRLSTFSIWFRMTFSLCLFQQIVYQSHQKLSKRVKFLMLDSKEYSFLVKMMCRFCMKIILAVSWLFIKCCLQTIVMVFIH